MYGPNPTWGASLRIWGDGRNGLVDTETASVTTTNGNLHLDAGSSYDTYINYYDGQAIHFGRGNYSDRALLNSAGLALYDWSFIGNLTGNATTATSASSVPWTWVTWRPTVVSAFTNDSAYITNSNSNYLVNPANGNGICFWLDCTNYKISMGVWSDYQYWPVTDFSIKTQMDVGSTGRGFTWWRTWNTPVAAINATTGDMRLAGAMTIWGDLTVEWKVITDTLVNRTVQNLTVSGSLYPYATSTSKDIGATGNRWNDLWLSGNANVSGTITAGSFVGNATSASSVPWSGVTGKPTTVSTWTNDSGYLTAWFASTVGQPASTALANESGYGAFQAQSLWSAGTAGAAFMSFHRPGAYAAYLGLDTDNQFKVGGWSMGATSYALLHAWNFNSYAPTLAWVWASGTWGISVTGNAATATLASSVPWSGVTGKPTTVAWYGITDAITTGNIGSQSVAYATNAGNAATATTSISTNLINAPDGDRNAATKLPTTNGHGVRFDFVNAGTTDGGGNYAGLMTYAPWDGTSVSTGDASYQIGFNSPGTNASGVPYLTIRNGINSTWNTWYTMLNSGNFNSYAPTLAWVWASGTWGISVTGNAATATLASSVPWSGVTGKPTTVAWYGITDAITTGNIGSQSVAYATNAGNAATATSASSVPWSGVTGKPTTISGITGADSIDANPDTRLVSWFYQQSATTTANGWPVNWSWWHLMSSTHSNTSNYYAMQFAADFFSNDLRYRSTSNNGNASWNKVLIDNGGTYNVAISGNAATASSVPWSGITGAPAFATSNVSGRVRAADVGCEGGWGTSCDANTNGRIDIADTASSVAWAGITSKPTTIAGYGITDAVDLTSWQNITGIKYFLSNKWASSTVGANNSYALEAFSNDGWAAAMSFHRGGYYAVNLGLDPDNVFRLGWWSAAANRWQVDMSGNETIAGNLSTAWAPTNYYNINAGSIWSTNLYTYNSMCAQNASGDCTGAGWVVIWRSNTTAAINLPVSGNTIINNGSNVGIGTTTPSQKLSIEWNAVIRSMSPTLYLRDTDNRSAMIHNNNNLLYFLRGCGNDSESWCTTGNDWPLYLNLETNAAMFGGDVYAFNYYYRSDIRLKQNIIKIVSPLEKIEQLNGYTFDWKKDGKHDIGIIAQEVEKVFPEIVWESKDARGNTYKSVQYGNLVAPLIEAIKELAASIKNNTHEIDALKIENESLKKRLDTIEARLNR
jgi:hypothetical protein